MRVLLIVQAQQILTVIVAVRRANRRVNVLAARLAPTFQRDGRLMVELAFRDSIAPITVPGDYPRLLNRSRARVAASISR